MAAVTYIVDGKVFHQREETSAKVFLVGRTVVYVPQSAGGGGQPVNINGVGTSFTSWNGVSTFTSWNGVT